MGTQANASSHRPATRALRFLATGVLTVFLGAMCFFVCTKVLPVPSWPQARDQVLLGGAYLVSFGLFSLVVTAQRLACCGRWSCTLCYAPFAALLLPRLVNTPPWSNLSLPGVSQILAFTGLAVFFAANWGDHIRERKQHAGERKKERLEWKKARRASSRRVLTPEELTEKGV